MKKVLIAATIATVLGAVGVDFWVAARHGGNFNRWPAGGVLVGVAVLYYKRAFEHWQTRAQQVPQPPDTDIELMGKSKRVSRRSDKK